MSIEERTLVEAKAQTQETHNMVGEAKRQADAANEQAAEAKQQTMIAQKQTKLSYRALILSILSVIISVGASIGVAKYITMDVKVDSNSMLYGYFMEKCSAPYNLFLKERNNKTEIDDLIILSNRLNVE